MGAQSSCVRWRGVRLLVRKNSRTPLPIKGLKTVQQNAAENEVHPTQVTQWKSQMIEGASEVFEQGRGRHSREQAAQIREERLELKIGQLVVEVDWLSKKFKELRIDP
jgi:transposase